LPITTQRLINRPCTLADFEATPAVWSGPEVMALIPSKPYDRETSWARLCEKISRRHPACDTTRTVSYDASPACC
jgi:hypothetical protein